MSTEDFLASPWATSHRAYDASAINIRPAPEFATAEVVVASTYRAVGFHAHAEGSVPAAGRDLDKQSRKRGRGQPGAGIGLETWRTILHGALESPKMPKQSSRRFLQLCPIVPDVALYSGSARLSGNSWNPGQLVERMVRLGSPSMEAAQDLWADLFQGLSVTDGDDVWARWLQGEFERRRIRKVGTAWALSQLSPGPTLPDADKNELKIPAVQFTRDIAAILRAKSCMTRRQWVSLLEAILRLGAVSHVLWICDVNDRLWRIVRQVIDGGAVPSERELRTEVFQERTPYLVYGAPALPIIKGMASRYLGARLGLNLMLWLLEDEHIDLASLSLSSSSELKRLLELVKERREDLIAADVLTRFELLRDKHSRTVSCKRGIGSNLVEFCRHTLGQRQAADENLRGYDQGYQLKKRAEYKSAPWVVSLGPVALLALVHCCLEEAAGPRSVQRLSEHLAWYGVDVDRDDIAKSDLGRKLRMLGLVLDSPDAESGMLLIPPFELPKGTDGGGAE